MTVKPGIYQSAAQFDRYDAQVRRTYLAVDPGGHVVIANLPECRATTRSDIGSAPNRWTSVGPWMSGFDLQFEAAHGAPAMKLKCDLSEGHVDVIDPAQDGWGGFGGRYEAVASD